jgi:hypothetical protein
MNKLSPNQYKSMSSFVAMVATASALPLLALAG